MFVFYLERHIDLDTERHGPAAKAIIEEMFGNNDAALLELHRSARSAVRERLTFWDGVLALVEERRR
jgi:hypothetical protein